MRHNDGSDDSDGLQESALVAARTAGYEHATEDVTLRRRYHHVLEGKKQTSSQSAVWQSTVRFIYSGVVGASSPSALQ